MFTFRVNLFSQLYYYKTAILCKNLQTNYCPPKYCGLNNFVRGFISKSHSKMTTNLLSWTCETLPTLTLLGIMWTLWKQNFWWTKPRYSISYLSLPFHSIGVLQYLPFWSLKPNTKWIWGVYVVPLLPVVPTWVPASRNWPSVINAGTEACKRIQLYGWFIRHYQFFWV